VSHSHKLDDNGNHTDNGNHDDDNKIWEEERAGEGRKGRRRRRGQGGLGRQRERPMAQTTRLASFGPLVSFFFPFSSCFFEVINAL